MGKLKLSEWAHVAEIFTSVVVIISLVYVGLEVNQNTQSLQNESYLSVMEVIIEGDNILATDAELNRIAMAANKAPSSVSAEEWSRYEHLMYPRFGIWEYLYLAKQQSAISDAQWLAFEPYFHNNFCHAGWKHFWEKNHWGYAGAFQTYIKTQGARECEGE